MKRGLDQVGDVISKYYSKLVMPLTCSILNIGSLGFVVSFCEFELKSPSMIIE